MVKSVEEYWDDFLDDPEVFAEEHYLVIALGGIFLILYITCMILCCCRHRCQCCVKVVLLDEYNKLDAKYKSYRWVKPSDPDGAPLKPRSLWMVEPSGTFTTLACRDRPSVQGAIVGRLRSGAIVRCLQRKDNFIRHDLGWSAIQVGESIMCKPIEIATDVSHLTITDGKAVNDKIAPLSEQEGYRSNELRIHIDQAQSKSVSKERIDNRETFVEEKKGYEQKEERVPEVRRTVSLAERTRMHLHALENPQSSPFKNTNKARSLRELANPDAMEQLRHRDVTNTDARMDTSAVELTDVKFTSISDTPIVTPLLMSAGRKLKQAQIKKDEPVVIDEKNYDHITDPFLKSHLMKRDKKRLEMAQKMPDSKDQDDVAASIKRALVGRATALPSRKKVPDSAPQAQRRADLSALLNQWDMKKKPSSQLASPVPAPFRKSTKTIRGDGKFVEGRFSSTARTESPEQEDANRTFASNEHREAFY